MPINQKYFTNSATKHTDSPSKRDINKLLSFSECPEKYATGTSKAKEKVQYLESIKHKFSRGQLLTYNSARDKYEAALAAKVREKAYPKRDYKEMLLTAFNERRSVKIRYKGLWRIIDPYALNKTYIVSYCHSAQDMRTFRIDRIQEVELAEAFNFNESLQTAAQNSLIDAPSYRGYRSYRYY